MPGAHFFLVPFLAFLVSFLAFFFAIPGPPLAALTVNSMLTTGGQRTIDCCQRYVDSVRVKIA